MNVCGVTFGGYLAKKLSFKLGNLLYKSNFYLLSEDTVWWGVGIFPILDICNSSRSNPLHFLVTSPSRDGSPLSHARRKSRNFFEKTKVNSSEILPFFRHQTIQFWMLQHHLMMKEAGISKLTNQSSRSTISLYKLKCNLLAPSKMTNLVQNLI